MAITKWANGRWLTVLNSNNLTAKDYQALLNLKPNARRLYEYICYADYSESGNRFQFSSTNVYYDTGIDPSDVCKAWNELETAGVIWLKEGTTNEYSIKANVGNTQLCEQIPQSIYIKSEDNSGSPEMAELVRYTQKDTVLNSNNTAAGTGSSSKGRKIKMTHIYSHNNHVCIMTDLTKTAAKLATKLMTGDIEYNAQVLSEEFGCEKRSVEKAYTELTNKNYIITIGDDVHFCCIPYFDCTDGYSKVFPDWNSDKDKLHHCEFCDTRA